MKTLIINGSPRTNGDTSSLLRILIDRLSGDFRIIDCYRANIAACVDCRKCRETPECSIKDDMQEIYSYIEDCDNIIIASPIYFSELTGRLLDAASRFQMYYSAKSFQQKAPHIKPKKGLVILVGGGSGNPQKAYETAVCLLHQVNTADIFPLICSHNTDITPADKDEKVLRELYSAADFLNNSGE